MPVRKIAISIPAPVLEAVDALAEKRGESRSRLISELLARVARAKRDADVTAAIDAVLSGDEGLAEEQIETSRAYLGATRLGDERW